jgi:hypothetical protein
MPARNYAIWSAPSADQMAHRNIRLDCTPETLRNLWRATDKAAAIAVLAHHFKHTPTGTVNPDPEWHIGEAEDLFATTRWEGNVLLPFGSHKRELVNKLAGFHGVETLGVHTRSSKEVRYCDAGDTYAPTLCFMGRRMFIGSWGDLIESRRVKPYEG